MIKMYKILLLLMYANTLYIVYPNSLSSVLLTLSTMYGLMEMDKYNGTE